MIRGIVLRWMRGRGLVTASLAMRLLLARAVGGWWVEGALTAGLGRR